MKILLFSDLHEDIYDYAPRHKNTDFSVNIHQAKRLGKNDVILVAGDVGNGPYHMNSCLKYIASMSAAQVIAVMGNHDYYGSAIDTAVAEAKVDLPPNAMLLENETIVVDGTRFICATLWTSVENGKHKYAGNISDYHAIYKNSDELISVDDTINLHNNSYDFIIKELEKPFSGATVVMTHHAPSFQSVSVEFVGSPLNPFFAADLDSVILKYQPNLWVHGHMHTKMDYTIGNTRIVCHPRGYPTEQKQLDYFPLKINV